MLLRIMRKGEKQSEFIFVPFGCALAIPVNLIHAGVYSKPGSKNINRRLHIVVTERDALKYHEKQDHLHINGIEEDQFPSERFEEAMKPNAEQDWFSKMYLKLYKRTATKLIGNVRWCNGRYTMTRNNDGKDDDDDDEDNADGDDADEDKNAKDDDDEDNTDEHKVGKDAADEDEDSSNTNSGIVV
ncbi:unnamed protein product [Cylindrotheca closterium]|nr:unnamed protein product [Cylindrotheca closterium]